MKRFHVRPAIRWAFLLTLVAMCVSIKTAHPSSSSKSSPLSDPEFLLHEVLVLGIVESTRLRSYISLDSRGRDSTEIASVEVVIHVTDLLKGQSPESLLIVHPLSNGKPPPVKGASLLVVGDRRCPERTDLWGRLMFVADDGRLVPWPPRRVSWSGAVPESIPRRLDELRMTLETHRSELPSHDLQ